MQGELRLRGLENCKRSRSATGVKQATAAGGDMLVVAGAEAEEVAELVIASAEALRRGEALERDRPEPGGPHAAGRNGRRAHRSAATWSSARVPLATAVRTFSMQWAALGDHR